MVAFVRDQFVKQYSMCEKIIAYTNFLATPSVKDALVCLKLLRLYFIMSVIYFYMFFFLRESRA